MQFPRNIYKVRLAEQYAFVPKSQVVHPGAKCASVTTQPRFSVGLAAAP